MVVKLTKVYALVGPSLPLLPTILVHSAHFPSLTDWLWWITENDSPSLYLICNVCVRQFVCVCADAEYSMKNCMRICYTKSKMNGKSLKRCFKSVYNTSQTEWDWLLRYALTRMDMDMFMNPNTLRPWREKVKAESGSVKIIYFFSCLCSRRSIHKKKTHSICCDVYLQLLSVCYYVAMHVHRMECFTNQKHMKKTNELHSAIPTFPSHCLNLAKFWKLSSYGNF